MIEKRKLGSTDIEISRIGISSSFGAEEAVYHQALEYGCNYFTWGTFIKGRSKPFLDFISSQVAAGKREDIVLGLLSYSHLCFLGDLTFNSALKKIGTDYIDGLILGYFSKRPPQRLLDWAIEKKESGRIRAIGITTHNRELVTKLASEGIIDYFHFRYNAVNSGAEQDIFPKIENSTPGMVSFTATAWGKLMDQSKMEQGVSAPTAGDCYRFVLSREEIDCCMMGVKNSAMLQENMRGIAKGVMGSDELARMRGIGDYLYGRKR